MDDLAVNVYTLTGRVDSVTDNIEDLSGRVGDLTDNVETLTDRVDTMGGTVSRVAGDDYESHVCSYAERFLRRQLGIHGTVWATLCDKDALTNLLNTAEMEGRLSLAEVDELDQADLILVSHTPDGHGLVEVFITIQQSNVDRATSRAGLVAKATGREAIAVVAGKAEEVGLDRREARALITAERLGTFPG